MDMITDLHFAAGQRSGIGDKKYYVLFFLFFTCSHAICAEKNNPTPADTIAQAENPEEEAYAEEDEEDGGDEFNLTPRYLMDQFAEDSHAAWKKYKDKQLSVTGYIREIGKDKDGRYVIIGTNPQQNNKSRNIIKCYLEDFPDQDISGFQPGEFVRVEGLLVRKDDGLNIKKGTVNKSKEPNTFNREFVPPKFKKCERCNGSGFVRVEKDKYNSKKMLSNTKRIKCPACNGRGKIKVSPGYYKKIDDPAEDKNKKD